MVITNFTEKQGRASGCKTNNDRKMHFKRVTRILSGLSLYVDLHWKTDRFEKKQQVPNAKIMLVCQTGISKTTPNTHANTIEPARNVPTVLLVVLSEKV